MLQVLATHQEQHPEDLYIAHGGAMLLKTGTIRPIESAIWEFAKAGRCTGLDSVANAIVEGSYPSVYIRSAFLDVDPALGTALRQAYAPKEYWPGLVVLKERGR